jgi:hypothetical protein
MANSPPKTTVCSPAARPRTDSRKKGSSELASIVPALATIVIAITVRTIGWRSGDITVPNRTAPRVSSTPAGTGLRGGTRTPFRRPTRLSTASPANTTPTPSQPEVGAAASSLSPVMPETISGGAATATMPVSVAIAMR